MLISVVNHTKGKLSDEQAQEGIRAVNRQIAHDFRPHWDFGAELRLEGAIGDRPMKRSCPSCEATRSSTCGMKWTSMTPSVITT